MASLALFSLGGGLTTADAAPISFGVNTISGNTWEYIYIIENATLSVDIEEFTIFFDVGLYENLIVSATPVDWNPLVIQPDAAIPDDGFYDALALVMGIAPGAYLAGFSVQFDFLGAGTPGAQPFDIVDPVTFATLKSGVTTPIPEPGTFVLLLAASLGMIASTRKR